MPLTSTKPFSLVTQNYEACLHKSKLPSVFSYPTPATYKKKKREDSKQKRKRGREGEKAGGMGRGVREGGRKKGREGGARERGRKKCEMKGGRKRGREKYMYMYVHVEGEGEVEQEKEVRRVREKQRLIQQCSIPQLPTTTITINEHGG